MKLSGLLPVPAIGEAGALAQQRRASWIKVHGDARALFPRQHVLTLVGDRECDDVVGDARERYLRWQSQHLLERPECQL